MASHRHHLLLLLLSHFLLLSHADWNLRPSDSEALWQVMEDLGVNGQPSCNSPGIFCERRVSRSSSEFRVTRIVFKSQHLNGFLSTAIGRLSELKELSLPDNRLFDEIPPQIGNCRKIQVLNLKSNRFSGEIPDGFSSLVDLRILDLSSNQFSGDLGFLRNFRKVENLSLSDNLFAGKVPSFLASFRNLKFLNLTANRLDSAEPQIRIPSLRSTKARMLPRRYRFEENSTNSTRNNATAPAPKAPPHKTSNSSTSSAPAPAPTKSQTKKHRKHTKSLILGFFIGAIAGVLSGLAFTVLFRVLVNIIRGRGRKDGPEIFSPMIKNAEELAFLEQEDGISSLEMIGKGGCGEVYKAELPGGNGKLIAVKKILQPKDSNDINEEDSNLLSKRMRQIRSEIQTVGHIRHRNLLPLLAHVARPDCHYLVYEYMKNGSLHDVLRQVSEGTRELDWQTRHRIAMGVAAGLEYLHMNHNPRIIHRDLKPGNILLDDDMEARITDFGLAKAMPEANTHVTSSNVAGTVGFIAPEYHQTLKFTDKCDIYSFGVVLVSLVMGKLPSDEFFQSTDEMSLVKWIRNVMASNDHKRAIDPKLLGQGFDEQMGLVLKIACFCTMDDPKQRPNSKDVRCMLSQVKNPET